MIFRLLIISLYTFLGLGMCTDFQLRNIKHMNLVEWVIVVAMFSIGLGLTYIK